MILRTSSPPPTSRVAAPRTKSETPSRETRGTPPAFGSSFFSSFGGGAFGGGGGASAFGGGGGASSFLISSFFFSSFLGAGHSALATTSPATASGGTSGQPAFALAPPAAASAFLLGLGLVLQVYHGLGLAFFAGKSLGYLLRHGRDGCHRHHRCYAGGHRENE